MIHTDWHGCYDSGMRGLIVPAAFAHPAKMSRALGERIFDHGQAKGYWRPGDLIVDPFGGISTTGLIGAYRGYRVVTVELEPRFVELGNANIEKNRRHLERLGLPLPVHVQGDSRRLGEIVAGAAGALLSPPYGGNDDRDFTGEARDQRRGYQPERFTGSFRRVYSGTSVAEVNPANAGDMPTGDHAAVVGALTSPPYADSLRPETPEQSQRRAEWIAEAKTRRDGRRLHVAMADVSMGAGYTTPTGAITSPPYANSINANASANDATARARRKISAGIDMRLSRNKGGPNSVVNQPQTYGGSAGNLGAMSADTYWSAVAQVYRELHALLPIDGAAAVVVKDYVKDKKRVPLCDQTAELLEALGFTVVERCWAWLVKERRTETLFGDEHVERTERKSFFRRMAERNGSPRIDWEEVVWVVK